MKNIYILLAIGAFLVGIGIWIGRATKGEKVRTITETKVIHDTTNTIKYLRGKTLVIHKADTIEISYEDTAKIASYEAIIEQLSQQTNPSTDEGQSIAGGAVVKPTAYLRAGLGLDATIDKSPVLTPKVSLMLLNHLTACYGYDFKNAKHIAGVGWLF